MKRFIAFFCMCLWAITNIPAQQPEKSYLSRVFSKYERGIRLEPQVSVKFEGYHAIPTAEFVLGMRYNDYLRFGIGVGFARCGYPYDRIIHMTAQNQSFEGKEYFSAIPVTFNLKYTFLPNVGRYIPFMQFNYGGYAYAQKTEILEPGVFGNLSLGVDYKTKYGKWFAELGATWRTATLTHKLDNSYTTYDTSSPLGMLLGIGFCF